MSKASVPTEAPYLAASRLAEATEDIVNIKLTPVSEEIKEMLREQNRVLRAAEDGSLPDGHIAQIEGLWYKWNKSGDKWELLEVIGG